MQRDLPAIPMTTGEFATGDWVERLARTLGDLGRIQDAYWDELYGDYTPSSRSDGFRDPSDNFQSFYWRACYGQSRFDEERYGPVRAALAAVRRVLAVHPAWAGLVARGPAPDGGAGGRRIFRENGKWSLADGAAMRRTGLHSD